MNSTENPKIVVATDSKKMKAILSDRIKEPGAETFFFDDTHRFFPELKNQSGVEAVFIDLDMVGLNPSKLLHQLHEDFPLLKVVVISKDYSPRRVRMAMHNGVFDFIPKPVDINDFDQVLKRTLAASEELKKKVTDYEELVSIEHELDVARNIQNSIGSGNDLIPNPSEYSIAGRNQAAQKVGGDFFDYFALDENNLGFVIGDVASKGIPAAIFMAVSRTLFKAIAAKGVDPASCLKELNRVLAMESDPALFIAIFYGILNLRSGEIQYANGGHTYPIIVRADGNLRVLDRPSGVVLGVLEETDYRLYHETMQPGDIFFMATDGFDELNDMNNKPVSDHFLKRILIRDRHETADKIIDSIYQAVSQIHPDYLTLDDDITCLLLKYLG
ncbi:MAG: response regulator [Calditrichales bacterium]|nr:MAG: response regulator [Calditrichales bacterium]